MLNPFPGRFRLLLIYATAYLGVTFVLRLLLWRAFGSPGGVTIANLPIVLGAGAVNDLAELLYLLAPLCLYLLLLPQKLARHPLQQKLFVFTSFLFFFSLLPLAATEYFFFEKFTVSTAPAWTSSDSDIRLLLINAQDNFPAGRFILAALFLALFVTHGLWPIMRESLEQTCPLRERARALVLYALLLTLTSAFYSTEALAWSSNRLANELSANGLSRLFRTLRAGESREPPHGLILSLYFSKIGPADE